MKKLISIALIFALLPVGVITAFASTIQVVIYNDGPPADFILVGENDVVLNQMIITPDNYVEVQHLTVTVNATGTGLVSYSGDANFTDFKIVDLDSGDTLMGPVELDVAGSGSAQTLDFTDAWEIDRSDTRFIAITCDVADEDFLDGTEIWADLEPVSTTDGIQDVTYGDYVTDIVPLTAISGNVMTVGAPSLDVSLASTPVSDTVVSGESDVALASFVLSVGDASDVAIAEIILAGYIDEDDDADYSQGVDRSIYIRDVVSSVWLENADGDVVGSSASFSGSGDVTFSGMSWDIEAGETELLKVFGDISGSAPDAAIYVDIDDASFDITVEDEEGNTFEADGDNANGMEDSPNVVMTVVESGTLSVVEYTSDPVDDQIVAADTDDLLVGKFKLTAVDEDWEVDEMVFTVTDEAGSSTAAADLVDNIDSMRLLYPTDLDSPDVLDGDMEVSVSGTNAVFTGLGAMVPEADYVVMELYVDLAQHALDGGSLDSDDEMYFALNTSDDYGVFSAIARTSGAVMDESDLDDVVTSNVTYVYRSVPIVAEDTSLGSSLVVDTGVPQEIYRFTIEADDNGDIIVSHMTFDILTTGVVLPFASFDITEYGSTTSLGTVRFVPADGYVIVRFSRPGVVVSAGSSSTFSIYADVIDRNPHRSNEMVAMRVHSGDDHVPVDTVPAVWSALSRVGMVWSDAGSQSGSHGGAVAEWMSGYEVEGLPMSYTVLN